MLPPISSTTQPTIVSINDPITDQLSLRSWSSIISGTSVSSVASWVSKEGINMKIRGFDCEAFGKPTKVENFSGSAQTLQEGDIAIPLTTLGYAFTKNLTQITHLRIFLPLPTLCKHLSL
jgi:hypothetical protein